jgi:putative tryptophan/tyrosine transport system substrate-binding protein
VSRIIQKKKIVTLALGAMLFAVCSSADAQQTGRIFRIGYLDASDEAGSALLVEPFRNELSKLGWTEGKNLVFEYRFAAGRPERQDELAAELVRLKVDLIVVAGVGPTSAAKRATTTIPIVMAPAGDPVAAGLVASLARPGGNVTGLSALATDLNTKRVEILKDAVPNLVQVGYLRARIARSSESLQATARALKLKLEEIETEVDAKALESAFQTARQKQVGAIMITPNRSFFGERKRIVELARKHRLPAVYSRKAFVDAGGLMSYGVDYTDLYRRAAIYVDKILKGAKPADLPVQQATKFEFIINLKAAKQIGLTIPVRVRERANQVIR